MLLVLIQNYEEGELEKSTSMRTYLLFFYRLFKENGRIKFFQVVEEGVGEVFFSRFRVCRSRL